MKKRYLRKEVEITLSIITMLIIMFFGMLEDFELSTIPVLAMLLAILLFNSHILLKYGKGNLLEE